MFIDVMQIDAKFLLEFIKPFAVIVLIIGLLFKYVFYNSFDTEDASDILVNFVKMSVYGCLAGYIYIKVKNSGATEIDVLTFFTFLLACLESMHCFLNSIGTMFVGVLKTFIFPPRI
ncbi:hypothetical protein [Lysinibacillus sphaericus]|uniref:hypothetical protein n=1 Tax=Lysinibacillus sphaericus TaxID=1421 RepID=UPI003D7F4374